MTRFWMTSVVRTRKHGMASMVAMQELEGWMEPAEMKELGDWKGRKVSRQDRRTGPEEKEELRG